MEDRREQSVSREEHEQLLRDLTALQDQFEAAGEVLSAMGRSASDPDTVLTTIVESARRLCRSDASHLYLLQGGRYRLIQSSGLSEETIDFITEHPQPLARETLLGRVGLDRSTQQISDVLTDPDYGASELQRVAGYRTTMGAPMLLDDEVVGALTLWRNDVSPFDEREMAIVTAFAGQAAMAVNGVKLVQELEARGAELAKRVDELEALSEVGTAVSSSLDVDHVLSTIAMHAVKLSGTDGGSIMEYSERDRSFQVGSVYRTKAEVVNTCARSGSISMRPSSGGRRGSGGRSPSPTWARSSSTPISGSSTRPDGAPSSLCRCCGRTRSSAA
jgi:transcriptional regulator with GAF, ATPase, and Fis domain